VLPISTYGCDGLDMSVGNVNRLNVCWNDLYRKIFGFHRWESVKHVQLYCERLDMVRIVQLRRLSFLNGLCGSLNEVICQCYSWYWRGKKFYKVVMSIIFDVFAKFKAVCESWLGPISHLLYNLGHWSICLSVCISSFYVFICLPEWWINVYIII